jgi:pyruvate dehydrogenase E2 component (dihydrolipoamide acetyltransferase)
LAKPPVRRLARDLGVDLRGLAGTGRQGSITRADVVAVADGTNGGSSGSAGGRDRRIPVHGVRRAVAENLVASAFSAPHVTEFLTIDMTRSMRLLDRLRAVPDLAELRFSPLLLVARAVLAAIRRHPMVNSTWAGDEIIIRGEVNLGIAVATDRGLIVPAVKGADQLTTRELAEALAGLAVTARAGRAAPADLVGGTFTITNVGVFGVDTGTPILPPGQAAILALGAVRDAPWVHKGKIRVRKVTTLGLSFDHRIIDGELGSRFLRDVGTFLTDPGTFTLAWG